MRALLRSDLFRNFMGGFVLGTIAILMFQPQAQTTELKTRIQAAYVHIL